MNSQPRPRVQVRTVDALVAVVPYLLGFHPELSLVVVALDRPHGRVRLAFRFDLPQPPDPALTAEIARRAVTVLARNQFSDAILIGYGPGALVTPVVDFARRALLEARISLHDVLRVKDGRCWSYQCSDPSCCPAEGTPVSTDTHPAAAALVVAGFAAAPSREALAATIAELDGPEVSAMRDATAQVERAARQLGRSDSGALLAEGLAAVQDAITAYRDGGSLSTPREFARLAMALTILRIRDDAWARMDPQHRHAHIRLWADLTRRACPGYVAAPAALLAFTAWQAGLGALANLALDRALADDPAYSLARLIRDALAADLPPTVARLPMTPEEVAASYDDRSRR